MTLSAFWRASLPGLAALLIGLGLARFGYTPMIPALIDQHWLNASEAAYLGAANLGGYLLGSVSAVWVAGRIGMTAAIRFSMVFAAISLFACALDWGFWWFLPWRFLSGAVGALLMVLAAPYSLARIEPARRARGAGVVFTGVGLGVASSGMIVPLLAPRGVELAWLAMAMAVTLLTLMTWGAWRGNSASANTKSPGQEASRPAVSAGILLLLFAYALDGAAGVPHGVFWADYIARGLGRGIAAGGQFWIFFGIGALCGPMTAGLLAEKLGFERAMLAVWATKTIAVLLPVVSTSAPVLILSVLAIGAFTPGITAILSGHVAELVGVKQHPEAWSWMTTAFALMQAAGGYGFSYIYAATASYDLLFIGGGSLYGIAVLLALASGAAIRRARATDRHEPGAA